MNRAEAQRVAAFHAHLAIDGALTAGWDTLDMYPPADRDKVETELERISDRLRRRASKATR